MEKQEKAAEDKIKVQQEAAAKLSPNNRDDIDQPATGSRRFNNEQG